MRGTEFEELHLKNTPLDSPDLPLTFHTVDLCEFIQVYISKIYNEIDLAGFCVEAEMIEEKVLVRVDEHLFERVINNLIQNAIKYNPRGTTIKIIIENTENNVIFHIGDDGEGIPLVSGEDIFEPYAFKGNQGASPHGTGLGLAIAKKIITLHNGTIEYQSKPSEGFNTEYIIILPKTEINKHLNCVSSSYCSCSIAPKMRGSAVLQFSPWVGSL